MKRHHEEFSCGQHFTARKLVDHLHIGSVASQPLLCKECLFCKGVFRLKPIHALLSSCTLDHWTVFCSLTNKLLLIFVCVQCMCVCL